MTFLDIDSNCEDLDPGSPTEVITVTETPSVEYWENRSDNDYEEDIKNVVKRDHFLQRKGICADKKPGNMATNEEAKDPNTKVLIESDDEEENAVKSDNCFQRKVICADMTPGTMATNEEEKDPITKVLIESDDDLEKENGAKSISPSLTLFEAVMLMNKETLCRIRERERIMEDLDSDFEEMMRLIMLMKKREEFMSWNKREEDRLMKKREEFMSWNKREEDRSWNKREEDRLMKKREEFMLMKKREEDRLMKKREEDRIPYMYIKKMEKQIRKKEEEIKAMLPCERRTSQLKEVMSMKQEIATRIRGLFGIEEEAVGKTEQQSCYMAFLALLAYIVLFCTLLIKSVLQKQLSLKYSFVKAALLLLWTSGDVEKHPGPPLNDIKTIRELVPRLVKEIQGKKVADWATMPSCWDRNVVPFQDINKMKNSDNEEKYALFYEALSAFMEMFCRVPDWCVEEMTYVETGNAPELHKCQTARKIRELLEQHESSDREDILMRVGYQRQVGNVPGPAVNISNVHGHHQRVQRFPCNVPGFLPISKITTPETARQIAKGCMAQSKNAGKCQPGNQQTKTNKRSATTTNVQPAAKQPRTLAARTSSPRATSTIVPPTPASTVISVSTNVQPVAKQPRTSAARTSSPQATSTIVRPTTASTVISVANSRQSTPTASTVNQPRATTVITSSTSIATNPGPSLQTARNVTGQPSNPISTMSSVSAAPDTKPPNPDGQPSNLISLPSDDLDDLGFSSSVDLDQFINKILKDDKM